MIENPSEGPINENILILFLHLKKYQLQVEL